MNKCADIDNEITALGKELDDIETTIMTAKQKGDLSDVPNKLCEGLKKATFLAANPLPSDTFQKKIRPILKRNSTAYNNAVGRYLDLS